MSINIYLDVDGVLNAFGPYKNRAQAAGWDRFKTVKVNGWEIQFAPELIDHLNRIATHPDVQIKWLTTWEHDAATDLSPVLGLNGREWPVLSGKYDKYDRNDWWKLHQIRADVEETSPGKVIWIDDDLSLELEAIEWFNTLDEDRSLAISPRQETGITRENVAAIDALIATS